MKYQIIFSKQIEWERRSIVVLMKRLLVKGVIGQGQILIFNSKREVNIFLIIILWQMTRIFMIIRDFRLCGSYVTHLQTNFPTLVFSWHTLLKMSQTITVEICFSTFYSQFLAQVPARLCC